MDPVSLQMLLHQGGLIATRYDLLSGQRLPHRVVDSLAAGPRCQIGASRAVRQTRAVPRGLADWTCRLNPAILVGCGTQPATRERREMSVLKLLATIAICVGLVLPSAHSVALCLDSEGNLTLEAAVNGACAGSDSRCCEDDEPRGEESTSDSCYGDHCGSCRDVVIVGAGTDSPIPAYERARHASQPIAGTPFVIEEGLSTGPAPDGRTRHALVFCTAERSPPCCTSVLRL